MDNKYGVYLKGKKETCKLDKADVIASIGITILGTAVYVIFGFISYFAG